MTGSFIQIQDLSVDFVGHGAPVHAVRNASLEIPKARIMGLVGESGSGKSTVAMALLGLLAPNARVLSGTLTLSERRFDLGSHAELKALRGRDLAMVFQDPIASLNPVFTIGAHLDEVLRRQDRSLGDRRHRPARSTPGPACPRAQRRHAPARRHRDGAARAAEAPDCGRADDGAGCRRRSSSDVGAL
jgi:ABC-type glutathione transport system ATPase component